MKKIKPMPIIIGCMLILTVNLSAFFVFNGAEKGFCTNCRGTINDNLNQLIVLAAGHFLQSNSDYQLALKKIELSESGLIDSIGQAIKNISNANTLYFDIWETSKTVEYDPIVIEKLSQFDYTGYQVQNNLNPVIFQQVEDFLKQGHVRELFKKSHKDSSKILEKLRGIQIDLESREKIKISEYWRLNQLYQEFTCFGQYASEVFISI